MTAEEDTRGISAYVIADGEQDEHDDPGRAVVRTRVSTTTVVASGNDPATSTDDRGQGAT